MINEEPPYEEIKYGISFYYVKRDDCEGFVSYWKPDDKNGFSVSFSWKPEEGLEADKLEKFLNRWMPVVIEEFMEKQRQIDGRN